MTSEQISTPEPHDKPSSKPIEPLKKRNKYLYILLGLGGLGLIFLLVRPVFTSSSDNPPEAVARALPVETIEVESVNSYQVSRIYTGRIAALRTSNLGFNRGGEIEQVYAKEGDRVARGQALAKLDIRNLQTQRQQLVAEKARAAAQLAELQTGARTEVIDAAEAGVNDIEQQLELQAKQRERRELLYQEGAIAREELDEFSFGEGALQARLNQARSNLAELNNGTRTEQVSAQQASVEQLNASIADIDVNIDKSTLKAPFAGIVAKRELDEGTVANAGQSVIQIMEDAAPEARIGIPNKVANELTIGSSQTLKLGSQTYKATVASILPEVNANTRTQTVVFNLDRSAMTQINPGQTVRLESAEDINTDGYWLPTEALTQGIRGLWTCYVVTKSKGENYQVKEHAVEIVHQQGDRALVRGTLQAGDKIIANGTHRLVPGQKVEVISNK